MLFASDPRRFLLLWSDNYQGEIETLSAMDARQSLASAGKPRIWEMGMATSGFMKCSRQGRSSDPLLSKGFVVLEEQEQRCSWWLFIIGRETGAWMSQLGLG